MIDICSSCRLLHRGWIKMFSQFLLGLFLFIGFSNCQQPPFQLACPSGWILDGSRCYKAYTQTLSWVDAVTTCHTYGAKLVKVFGAEENMVIARIVKQKDASIKNYWIGFTRKHLPNPSDANNPAANWVTSNSSLEDTSIYTGFWGPGQPKPQDGACAMVMFSDNTMPTVADYSYGWKMANCYTPAPFVCEASAGLQGFFRCANGNYILNSPSLQCDGDDDCGDFSDEINCPNRCHYFIDSATGGNVATPNPYLPNTDCLWTLKTSVGKRIVLNFTEFNTEKDHDHVQLSYGGMTLLASYFIQKRLSGNLDVSKIETYHSSNNFMIVQFRSDSATQKSGFKFTWSTEDQYPGPKTMLTGSQNQVQYIQSPLYSKQTLPNARARWVISVPEKRRVISVQVMELDIPYCGFIEFYDGADFTAPKLDRVSMDSNPQIVISSQNTMMIYYHTCKEERAITRHKGFKLSYKTGCSGVINAEHGYVMSPGYNAMQNYPNYQTCEWVVVNPKATEMRIAFASPFNLQNTVDTLEIYEGTNSSGTKLATATGTSVPTALTVSSGVFYAKLATSSIVNFRGFKLNFATDCPKPVFRAKTLVTPSNFGLMLNDQISVSCPSGYEFGQEEFKGKSSVTMKCESSGWDVEQTPDCVPTWCGQAPFVQNGYYKSSTGSRFENTVTYDCYAGYGIQGTNPVVCQNDGKWPSPPSCVATSCSSISQSIQNGKVAQEAGTSFQYGSVYNYTCNVGYVLQGEAKVLCQGNGQWSASAPTCVRLSCPIEVLNLAFDPWGTLTPNTNVLVGAAVTASCDSGYQLKDASTNTIICEATQKFDKTPECEDVNECATNGGKGPCGSVCVNTIGSYMCKCNAGYTLDNDGKTCKDVNECLPNQVGKTYCEQGCVNKAGGYSCTCTTPGYTLYTTDGTQGFSLKNNENGLVAGDVLYLNHSCVRNLCPALSSPQNGKLLTTKTEFHFGDAVYYMCNLGYTLTGINLGAPIRCNSPNTWSTDPSTISCQVATCAIPSVTGLTYPPSFSVLSAVNYGTDVTVTCSQFRASPITFTKKCTYDYNKKDYALYHNDTSLECPIVDCGNPTQTLPSGSEIVGSLQGTRYNEQFTIRCVATYTQEGNTPTTGGVVKCGSDGNWDYGTFHCNGAACTDPGTLAGTIQTAASTYDPGNSVSYSCAKSGFTVQGDSKLTCNLQNNQPTWVGTPPTCKDTTKPVFSQAQSLCGNSQSPKIIDRLTPPNFQLPTVSDNTGATESSGIQISLTPATDTAAMQIAIATRTTFSYRATDFEGNQAACDIVVDVKDFDMPKITCPTSYTIYLKTSASQTINFPGGQVATATDNQGTPALTYSPSSVTVSGSDKGTTKNIQVTATDASGNTATCTYQVTFQADPCSDFVLGNPISGTTTCSSNGNGYTCNMQCNSGYYFFDQSGGTTLKNTLSFSCTPGSGFGITTMPDCIKPDNAFYYIKYQLQYKPTSPTESTTSGCLSQFKIAIGQLLTSVSANLTTTCQDFLRSALGFSGNLLVIPSLINEADFAIWYDSSQNLIYSNITFLMTPYMVPESDFGICADLFKIQFTYFYVTVQGLQNIALTDSCKSITSDKNTAKMIDLSPTSTDNSGEYRCLNSLGGKLVKYAGPPSTQLCFACPYGRYYNASTGICAFCPKNTYNDEVGKSSCKPCDPTGTAKMYTRSTGARQFSECLLGCEKIVNQGGASGFVSLNSDNLSPCIQCPVGQYADYSSPIATCSICDSGTKSLEAGAKSKDECKPLCPPGQYSNTGYMPCTPCPLHFYTDLQGATVCQECASDRITVSTGSNASTDCVVSTACSSNPCNGGSCTVANHHTVCTCPAGKTGQTCNADINYCASSPCYSGTCASSTSGFSCSCPNGYSGNRCETYPKSCTSNSCGVGQCQNVYDNTFKCLCPAGFTGNTCQQTVNICTASPCGPKGSCVAKTSRRRICNCAAGWSGETCTVNEDECASQPCLYGFPCVDGDNDYTCQCSDGYSGKNCEIRPTVCSSAVCSNSGNCVDDYSTKSSLCVCNRNYDGVSTSLAGTWLNAIVGIARNSQCTLKNYCAGNTADSCKSPGTSSCTNTANGPQCNCATGYSGFLCQHNTDDCASKPCGNNGKCIDGIDTFTCQCDTGYTGTRCEIDIQECVVPSYPCIAVGTDTTKENNGCKDLVGNYECICKPGYTGKNCQTNVNECLSNPCLHGGTCKDGVNDYTCECVKGWEGKRCEVLSQYCNVGTCQNTAKCLTVFGNYFCQCDFPYFGSQCELEASTCRDASPCVDANATCTEKKVSNGLQAQCKCSAHFTGEGCEYQKNYCNDKTFCKNLGHCRRTRELDGYKCDCIGDFYGDRCEFSQNDCAGVTCSNGGTCIDMPLYHYCQCPVGYEGEDCSKVRNPDFDFFFYDAHKVGQAVTAHVFPLGILGLDEFSIGMWVRFSDVQGTGTFFTLYGMDTRNHLDERNVLLRFDHNEAHITMSPTAHKITNDFLPYDINDSKWYYIMLTWVKATGKVELIVNSVRIMESTGHGMGASLPNYGSLVFGSLLDDVDYDEIIALKDKGFNGYISHAYIWKKALSFTTEVPVLAAGRNNTVREKDVILDWGSYYLRHGVKVVTPSSAGDKVCTPGFTGRNCDIALPDKVPPEVKTCPGNVHITDTTNRLSQVTWTEPTFEGATGTPRNSFLPGRVFTWGKYHNTYVALDAAGNAATCSFDIFVRNDDCNSPASLPNQGSATCSSKSGTDFYPYRTCTPQCNSGQAFSLQKPSFYTCGPQGSFNVNQKYNIFTYPDCAPAKSMLVNVIVNITYKNIQACDSILTVSGFRIPILDRIQLLDSLWVKKGTTIGAFCKGAACANSVTFSVACNPVSSSGRKKRQSPLSDAQVNIGISNVDATIQNKNTNAEQTPQEVLTSDALDNKGFTLTGTISGADPDEPSFAVTQSPVCDQGQVLIGTQCVDCAAGTRYDSATSSCVECGIGEYQDLTKQSTCKKCTTGKTTELMGSKAESACLTSCNTGAFYNKATSSCTPCAIGFFQNTTGQFFCYPCDADRTTTQTGSKSSSECFEVCPDGTELIATGTCRDCLIGYYRTSGIQASCEQCPTGFVTPSTKSRIKAECNIPDCQAGQRIKGTGCEACPLGTYQPQKWQSSCSSCPGSQTTLQTASTSALDCKFFCPAGQEEDPSNAGTCRQCIVGTYKDNAIPANKCTACPNKDYVTPAPGAISSSDCTVLACNPGYKANTAKTACEPCPRGTYQPLPNKDTCSPCGPNTSTRSTASNSTTQCESYCPEGQAEDANKQCVPCPIGTYRNNTVYEFGKCEMCPSDKITPSIGSADKANCTVANCTAGSYLDTTNNVCILCPIGQYQPDKWQTTCIACDTSGQRTTDKTGSTDKTQCRLECQPGYEDRGQDKCELCPVGYFKSVVGAGKCTQCPVDFITQTTGSKASTDCNVANCSVGTYRNTGRNKCVDCPRATFEDRKWQADKCQDCSAGLTTIGTKKTMASDCITNCPDGQQYNAAVTQCVPCPRGTYRKKDLQDVCKTCPNGTITPNVGSSFEVQCTEQNCTSGTYTSADGKSCIPCPKGAYQDVWWMKACKPCNSGFTTSGTGSKSQSDCVLDCPLGYGYKALTGNCEICAKGEYKDATNINCQPCGPGLTTASAGSTRADACSVANCPIGQYANSTICLLCPQGTYQDLVGSTSCKPCGNPNKVTSVVGATSSQQCTSTDECANGQNTCISSANGGVCVDMSGVGFQCNCRPGWTGQHPDCVHKCSVTNYCKNAGTCQGQGTDQVSCQCTNSYEGPTCESRIATTTTPAPTDYTNAIIGGAVGGGLGLLLLILIIACCCLAFRNTPSAPVKPPAPMSVVAPTVLAYDTLPTGTIVRPATRFGGSTLQPSMYNTPTVDGGQSIAGYNNSRFMFYDEAGGADADGGNSFTNNAYDPYEERTSTLLIS